MYPFRILLAGAMVASGVRADWLLDTYSVPAADSAAVNRLYGIQSFQNPSSKVTTKVAGGAVSLVAATIASDGTEGYTANIGLLHPLTPDWEAFDLTGLTAIQFEFRNSTVITEKLSIAFGSKAYSDDIAKAGTVFEAPISGSGNLAAGTTWKKASVGIGDFSTPDWWTTIPDDFPKIGEVLKSVKNLQFAPKTKYSDEGAQKGVACKTCVNPTMKSQTLEIRNIVLVGVHKYPMPNPDKVGCSGSPLVLDAMFDDNENDAGGYWFNYSDYDSTGNSTDPAKGSSASSYTLTKGDDFASGSINLKADLDKKVGSTWHKYAGWAAIGTGFEGMCHFKVPTLTGISFHLGADSLPSSIEGVRFKVSLLGIADSTTHSVMIPARSVKQTGGSDVCIRPEDLVQPGYVAEAQRADFDPGVGVKQFSWEVKIADQRDSLLSAAASVAVSVGAVKLFGASGFGTRTNSSSCAVESVQPRSPSHPFSIAYAHGSLNLRGMAGIAKVDILGLDGRRVASFEPSSSIPLRLSRGTWILAAHRRDGSISTQRFTVLDR